MEGTEEESQGILEERESVGMRRVLSRLDTLSRSHSHLRLSSSIDGEDVIAGLTGRKSFVVLRRRDDWMEGREYQTISRESKERSKVAHSSSDSISHWQNVAFC